MRNRSPSPPQGLDGDDVGGPPDEHGPGADAVLEGGLGPHLRRHAPRVGHSALQPPQPLPTLPEAHRRQCKWLCEEQSKNHFVILALT